MVRIFFLCILVIAQSAYAQDDDIALQAAMRGDFAKALEIWRPLAEEGNLFAQFNLGLMYEKGDGVPKDEQEAARWYFKSASQGHPGAQLNLGAMYDEGRGVPENNDEAAKWYHKATEQGDQAAKMNLELMRNFGEGDYLEGLSKPDQGDQTVDEIIVYGDISLGTLKAKIRITEDRAYSLFNELNDKDEFDIYCRTVVRRIGSNLKHRVCNPKFVENEKSDNAFLWRHGFASMKTNTLKMDRKTEELRAEIVRLGGEHPELIDAMNDMTVAQQAYQSERIRRGGGCDENDSDCEDDEE